MKLKQQVKNLLPTNQVPYIILGLSGGADSVFLFHMLKDLHKEGSIKLACAHLNHGWRKESIQDEEFCKKLCEKHRIKFTCKHAQEITKEIKYNGSQEEVGRKLRRAFFEEVLHQENANFIALAHHLDDQQETFLWRIMRGTTLQGLTCMKEKDGYYLRPLLSLTKSSIVSFLQENSLPHIEDPTNSSEDFLRNRIRKNVIPALKQCDKRFDKKFSDTLLHLQNEESFLQELTQNSYDKIFNEENGNLKLFKTLHPVLQNRLLIKWFSQNKIIFTPSKKYLNEVTRFLSSTRGGSHELHTSWKLNKKQGLFWIETI